MNDRLSECLYSVTLQNSNFSSAFLNNFMNVHFMFISCSFHVHFMFISCSFHVHFMFISCSFHVHFMFLFISCSFHVHFMFISCSFHVHFMFIFIFNTWDRACSKNGRDMCRHLEVRILLKDNSKHNFKITTRNLCIGNERF